MEGRLTVAGRIRSVYGHSEAEVEEKLRALGAVEAARLPRRSTFHPGAMSQREAAVRALTVAEERHLTRDDTARLVLASTRTGRTLRGIFGACVYCGDLFASSVDHQLPVSRSGTDDPSNVVSSCHPCNDAKGDQTPEEWAVAKAASGG